MAEEVQGAASIRRATHTEACGLVLDAALARGWGARHVAIAASGAGKTWWLGRLATYYAENGGDLVLVHDQKNTRAQYIDGGECDPQSLGGTVRATVEDFRRAPLVEGDAPIVVFHDAWTKESASNVARLAQDFARADVRVFVLVDETMKALKARQTWKEGDTDPLALCFTEGRGQGITVALATQIPQVLPTIAGDLADSIAIGRIERRSLNYVRDWVDPEICELLPTLQTGEIILIRDGVPWDRTIYGPDL